MKRERSNLADSSELRRPGSYQVSGSDSDQAWMKRERSHLADSSELRRPGSYQVSGSNRGQSWTKSSKISTGRPSTLEEESHQESADLVFETKDDLQDSSTPTRRRFKAVRRDQGIDVPTKAEAK